MSLEFSSAPEPAGEREAGSLVCLESLAAAQGQEASAAGPARTGGVYELKFLATEPQAQAILDWARDTLQPDPHADQALGDGYHVNSLYLDMPGFEIYRRGPGVIRQKYRVRRYGQEPTVWLEAKLKEQGRVWKRRSPLPLDLLHRRLTGPAAAESAGQWFRGEVDALRLRPVCQVTYERRAWVGMGSDGPIRLTLDRDLRAGAAREWQAPGLPLLGPSLLGGRRIVEFKFRQALPASFRRLLEDLSLPTADFSKYRTSVEACVPQSLLRGDGLNA